MCLLLERSGVSHSRDLLSVNRVKRSKHGGSDGDDKVDGMLNILIGGNTSDKITREFMADSEQLIFAEYAFMIRGNLLTAHLGSSEWQHRIDDMVKLREAFDNADIDGNNSVELGELEFVLMSMNAKAEVSPDQIKRLWDVLNPDGQQMITFEEFVRGMIQVKRDPQLNATFSIDTPNRFELLSLVIDSPINQAESDRLYERMNPLEKAGVRILRNLETAAQVLEYNQLKAHQTKVLASLEQKLDQAFDITGAQTELNPGIAEAIELLLTDLKATNARDLETVKEGQADVIKGKVLEACEGKLHFLTPQQRRKVTKLHYYCVMQAVLIAAVFTIIPGLIENLLCYHFETDGMIDAYWTCPFETRGPGGRGLDVGDTEWIGGSWVEPYDDFEMTVCPYGTCTSIPENPGDWSDLEGNPAVGGTWTNLKSKLSLQCTIANPWIQDCPPMVAEDCPQHLPVDGDAAAAAATAAAAAAAAAVGLNATAAAAADAAACPNDMTRSLVRQKPCSLSSWRWCSSADFGDDVGLQCSPLPATPLNSPRLHYWWFWNVIGIVLGIVFELSLLMYTALRSAVLVSEAVGLRLIPLNKDRAFVAEMLVRAAFEMVRAYSCMPSGFASH